MEHQLLHQLQFVTVCSGNLLDKPHLQDSVDTFSKAGTPAGDDQFVGKCSSSKSMLQLSTNLGGVVAHTRTGTTPLIRLKQHGLS